MPILLAGKCMGTHITGIHNTVNKIIILVLNNIFDNVNGLEINIIG